MPPLTWRQSSPAAPAIPAAPAVAAAGRGAAQRSSRWFFLAVRIFSAAGSKSGAMITSVKISATCAAISLVTVPFAAMTPPNADTGSQACALRCASARSAPSAMPHGLACFMIATHGSLNPNAARRAASAST